MNEKTKNNRTERLAILNTMKNIDMSILQQSDLQFTTVLLLGSTSFDNNKNTFIIDATVDSSWLVFASIELQIKSCIQYSYKTKIFIWDYLYPYSLLEYFYYIYVTALFCLFCWELFFSQAHQYRSDR